METKRVNRSVPNLRRRGIGLAAITAVISGVAVFVNSYGVKSWAAAGASSATYTTAKNLVAAALLVVLLSMATRRRSSEALKVPTRRSQWLGLVAVGVIGGAVPFLLFFEGLARATSSDAAFIHKTLILWVALLAIPLLRERLGAAHFAAIGLLLVGQATLGGASDFGVGTGEFMILAATLLWSVEVVVAKRLLEELSGLTVGVARLGLGSVVLITYGLATGGFAGLSGLGAAEWGWVILTGGLLTGYVATWFGALARAQAVDVTGMLVFGAVITAILKRGIQGAALAPAGVALVVVGVVAIAVPAMRAAKREGVATEV